MKISSGNWIRFDFDKLKLPIFQTIFEYNLKPFSIHFSFIVEFNKAVIVHQLIFQPPIFNRLTQSICGLIMERLICFIPFSELI